MIRVTVKNRDAVATPLSPITSGAVGLPVHFSFSDDWMQEGITRIACFRVPEIETIYSKILDDTNDAVVPWELLVHHGRVLFIGAYGENGEGTILIPTIWAEAGMIQLGTMDGEEGTEPTPSQWTQIRELAEEAASSAAAAESYAEHAPVITNDYWYVWNGEEYETTGQKATGEDGQDGDDGVSPDVEIQTITGGHSVTITDADHPSGQTFNVLDGEAGVSPGVSIGTITGGHAVTITDEDHPAGQTFNVMDGTPGNDGVSPEVSIQTITGGHTVTITDADHPAGQSFNVMDGQDGVGGIYYGVCTTAAATQEKAVTISGITAMTDGLSIRVRFTNRQDYVGCPTLNLNNLGAKSIKRAGGTSTNADEWIVGEVLDLVYVQDTDYWTIVDGGVATTGAYGMTKLSTSATSSSTSVAATPSAVKTVNDKVGDGQLDQSFTATDLTGAANELKTSLNAAKVLVLTDSISGTKTSYDFAGGNAAITTDMVVVNWEFGRPSGVLSAVTWNTDTAGHCYITGTFDSTAQTVKLYLEQKQ